MVSRMEALHMQLSQLLDNAQCLLAESVPSSTIDANHYGNRSNVNSTTGYHASVYSFLHMQAEIQTLEFWRSIIAECVATFFYVLIILNAGTAATDHSFQTSSALAAGLAVTMLSYCFGHVSGGLTNPALTLTAMLTKSLSPLRAVLYMCAQCGGGIAGAAVVLGVQARINDPCLIPNSGTLGMEFVLTFLISYAFCTSKECSDAAQASSSWRNSAWIPARFRGTTAGSTKLGQQANDVPPQPHQQLQQLQQQYRLQDTSLAGNRGTVRTETSFVLGFSYAACLMCWKGSANPARALGSAFVSRSAGRFDKHWIFWVGPMLGALTAAICHHYIFTTRRRTLLNTLPTNGNMRMMHHGNTGMGMYGLNSMGCDDELLDDLEQAKQQYKSHLMQQEFPEGANAEYGPRSSLYKRNLMGGTDPIYGGTKSLYNQSLYDSKSMYGAYDSGMGMAPLRRSRSIHSKFPPPPGSRRNPYDFLPEEPMKSDLLQSTIVNENGTSRLLGKNTSSYGGAAGDGYVGDKLDNGSTYVDGAGATGFRTKDSSSYDTYGPAKRERGFTATNDPYGTRRRNNDFYSTQYNAAYSQQNGCSIAPNNISASQTGGGGTVAPTYHGSSY